MPRPRKESQHTAQQESQHTAQPLLPTPSGLLDVEAAAQWLGVGRTKLFELMNEPDFPVIEISEKTIRFDPNSLYQWALKRQRTCRRAM